MRLSLSSNNRDRVVALYNIIRGNILNKNSNISPNDITILGYTTKLLRIFDAYYRHASHEKTNSMLETIEVMYMVHLNFLGKNLQETNSNYGWFKNITKHFQQKIFPNRSRLYDNDYITIRQHIAKLFTIYDLYETYSDTFETNMNEVCIRCHIPLKAFKAFREHYKEALSQFKNEVYSDNYKSIRDNKKLHFWMNSGTVKISTINSFKGWESEVVFLIIEPKYEKDNSFNLAFDELLYTGLTRCKKNLIIINFGNIEYDAKIRPLIEI